MGSVQVEGPLLRVFSSVPMPQTFPLLNVHLPALYLHSLTHFPPTHSVSVGHSLEQDRERAVPTQSSLQLLSQLAPQEP